MTAAEKAAATRREHAERQAKKQAQRARETELIRSTLTAVLESEAATPAEKLESARLLMELRKERY